MAQLAASLYANAKVDSLKQGGCLRKMQPENVLLSYA